MCSQLLCHPTAFFHPDGRRMWMICAVVIHSYLRYARVEGTIPHWVLPSDPRSSPNHGDLSESAIALPRNIGGITLHEGSFCC